MLTSKTHNRGQLYPACLWPSQNFLQKLGLFKRGTPHPIAYYPANMYLGTFEVILFT